MITLNALFMYISTEDLVGCASANCQKVLIPKKIKEMVTIDARESTVDIYCYHGVCA